MANTRVGLVRRVKTGTGWKYFPAAYATNGRVKSGVAIVAGRDVKHPLGYYALRFYEGSKLRFESLHGTTPADSENRRKKKEAQLSVPKAAKRAHLQVAPQDLKGKTLPGQLTLFVADALGRGAEEAAEIDKRACAEFLAITGIEYADEISGELFKQYHREMTKRGRSRRTVCNRDANVKSFLRFCGIDTKGLPKPPKYDKTMPEIYTDDQLTSSFRSITDPEQNVLYRLLLGTGLREREAVHLGWGDIDRQTEVLWVHGKPKWDFRVKVFEELALPLSDDLFERLMRINRNTVVVPVRSSTCTDGRTATCCAR